MLGNQPLPKLIPFAFSAYNERSRTYKNAKFDLVFD